MHNPAQPTRLLLLDSSAIFREAARQYLIASGEVSVIGAAATCREAAAAIHAYRPDIILAEYRLSDCAGPDMVGRLRRLAPWAGIIVLALLQDVATYGPLVKAAGADSFVNKSHVAADLLPAIRHILVRRPIGTS